MSPGRWQLDCDGQGSGFRGAGQQDALLFPFDAFACARRHSICGGSSSQNRQHLRSHMLLNYLIGTDGWLGGVFSVCRHEVSDDWQFKYRKYIRESSNTHNLKIHTDKRRDADGDKFNAWATRREWISDGMVFIVYIHKCASIDYYVFVLVGVKLITLRVVVVLPFGCECGRTYTFNCNAKLMSMPVPLTMCWHHPPVTY